MRFTLAKIQRARSVAVRALLRCQYQSTYNRTLAEQGSKVVLVKRKDMNKVTHSYTAQYVMTLSGKLLPTVFICLQEANGNFGPRVQNQSTSMRKYIQTLPLHPQSLAS
ncbi:HTH CENPB-type domain-containing protein [Trichonephila clavipes]|uniref:HTH CENPB-type domain-containing protein n=1 Tax=Trichonephila clavipes TaxID=2585209 RepID=A0A8X6VSY1_TRICX|nr:HTH CENPB-type domain-containing protein [Trichonephila clavipes]